LEENNFFKILFHSYLLNLILFLTLQNLALVTPGATAGGASVTSQHPPPVAFALSISISICMTTVAIFNENLFENITKFSLLKIPLLISEIYLTQSI